MPTQMDPHYPNPFIGFCPGGGVGGLGWCDGVRYPDGSFWHSTRWLWASYTCVVDNGTPLPAPAPPDGCGRGRGSSSL
jgi:hypothetical protein